MSFFTVFESVTLDQYELIIRMFKARTFIFSSALPRNILRHIEIGDHYIFNMGFSEYPLLRPLHPNNYPIDLNINGSHNPYMTDSTVEILYSFRRIKSLHLKNICFKISPIRVFPIHLNKMIRNVHNFGEKQYTLPLCTSLLRK